MYLQNISQNVASSVEDQTNWKCSSNCSRTVYSRCSKDHLRGRIFSSGIAPKMVPYDRVWCPGCESTVDHISNGCLMAVLGHRSYLATNFDCKFRPLTYLWTVILRWYLILLFYSSRRTKHFLNCHIPASFCPFSIL